MAANLVRFMTGTAAQFAAAVKDENTLYFITDERRLYKGNVPYSGGMYTKVQALPATGVINTVYGAADGSVAFWDGTQYQYLVPATITDIATNAESTAPATTAAIVAYVQGVNNDLDARLDVLEGADTVAGSVAKALKDAKDYTDTLAAGAVATNAADIDALESGKADKATTLAGYGITDGMTATEINTAITTAVANAHHLKREIVNTLPAVGEADVDTIYMVPTTASGAADGDDSAYDEYMVINGAWEKIGDSHVNLTDYATKDYADQAEADAVSTAAADATSKANQALADAQDYADGLMTAEVTRADAAYATAAQGAKADTAVQSVVEGDGNGQIKVDGTNINVHGLGSAAYTASTAYDAAGDAAQALVDAKDYTDQQIAAAALVWQAIA